MRYYICDKRTTIDGYHEVHTTKCPSRPPEKYIVKVGEFNNCELALKYLRKMNGRNSYNFIGCRFCCRPCAKVQSP